MTVTPGSEGGATEGGVGAGGPEGGALIAGGRATPDESRPGPGPQQTGRGGGGPFSNGGSTAAAASLGGRLRAPRRGAGPSVEVRKVTRRSEEESYLASNAPIVSIQGAQEWRGIRRRKKGTRAQDASSLHALAIGQGRIGLQANAARRRDTSCLPVEPRLLNRSTGTDARTERYSECNKNCGHGETRPRPVPDFQLGPSVPSWKGLRR